MLPVVDSNKPPRMKVSPVFVVFKPIQPFYLYN
jgi:hypothetical protein